MEDLHDSPESDKVEFEVAVNILQGLGDENPYQRPIAIHPTPLAAKSSKPHLKQIAL